MTGFPDSRFYKTLPSLSVSAILSLVGGRLVQGPAEPLVARVGSFENADASTLVFVSNKKNLEAAFASGAGVILIAERIGEVSCANDKTVIACASARAGFGVIASSLHLSLFDTVFCNAGIHPTADIGAHRQIAPTAIVSAGCIIGDDVKIGMNSVIGPGVEIGAGSFIGANVTISHAIIGQECRFSSGVIIGEAGFGYEPTKQGLQRVPQLGRVIIGDRVEIGAGSTVDRGALADTTIGNDTKMDNLVQVGHNVTIGTNCAIAAQAGISGSSTVGDNVLIGGQAGISDHVSIGSGAVINGGAGIMDNVPAGEHWGGFPAKLTRDWMREIVTLRKLIQRNRRN